MAKSRTNLRSELGRVRGLGSAKEGVQHWWYQRLTALALIPLLIWLVAGLVAHAGIDRAGAVEWLGSPVTFGLMLLVLGAGFWHALLGLQVVVEDYIHHEAAKLTLLILVRFLCIVLALAAAIALFDIAFGG
ncbi:MAG TPA: succinate dehydrogenase, hydrophobic membrane anchor protein [Hypericibacter adhaerens]|jgi:succinate dehydrogenase / fumarate reductase membrane anchor subunit|uniref:Succinate dehydrogenase hydrophobic membrane anchor subunit n=1 Tax=Hypericibacter adhaerens TaxID=2602016 RepID=A0A5J6N4C7_9PROT|nr:succinate dehydrogenase, hydrophobic membrane anchor protein [Hypericibacter adhaerens]QEX24778.1 succinate dehydrogenase, hydrophobic membrane anchor protein [Hypericibacter adhaerens]HWA44394.1 succinate dehydrogenase, hydrophobic membrane anchor protein [Hypericibacter adhaerens]